MLNNIWYFIAEGFRNFWHNKIMSFGSVIVVAISLFLLGSYFTVDQNAQSIKTQLQNMYEVQIFIDHNVSENRIKDIGTEIQKMENVKTMIYVSKEEALQELRKSWPEGSPLLEDITNTDNPLRKSYRITVHDIKKVDDTISKINSIKNINKIKNNKNALNFINSISSIFSTVSFWATAVFVIISFFLISNTIKIAVVSRKREIKILKYIGATNTFIRIPFVIEGILIGIIGALIAYLGLWQSYNILFWHLNNFFAGSLYALPVNKVISNLAIISIIAGPLVGAVSSGWSIKRYLNV